MEDKDTVEEIVAMLDNFMAAGGGHMNLSVEEGKMGVTVKNGADCTGNMACQVPTLHKGIDDKEKEGE